jgi:apolipoprotein N-acyltransferase
MPGTTFYSRHGDAFAWTCLALSLGLTGAALVVGRKA